MRASGSRVARSARALAVAALLVGGPATVVQAQVPLAAPPPGPAASPAGTPLPPDRATLEDGGVRIEVSVTPPRGRVGDLLAWEVAVDAPEGTAVSLPELGGKPDPFELREAFAPAGEQAADGRTIHRFRARLSLFDLGGRALPPAELVLRDPGGERRVALPAVAVHIDTVLKPDQTPALEAARGIRTSGRDLPVWAWLVAGLLLLAAVLGYLWWRRRRKRARGTAQTAEPELPCDVRALNDLRTLAAAGLHRAGRVKEHHVRLSEILRRYLGERYGFDALEMTSDELFRALREKRVPEAARDLVRRIVDAGDLVKFARYEPPASLSDEALDLGVRLVESTRPATVVLPPAPAAARAGGGR